MDFDAILKTYEKDDKLKEPEDEIKFDEVDGNEEEDEEESEQSHEKPDEPSQSVAKIKDVDDSPDRVPANEDTKAVDERKIDSM